MSVWHYTVGTWLRVIIADQAIKPATESVYAGEHPVVWLTTIARWEPTANKGFRHDDGRVVSLGKQETTAHGEGLYRIEVVPEAAPYRWDEYKRHSKIDERLAKSLARVAREKGSNYRDWRMSFEPITADKWLRIEIEVGNAGRWVEISMETAKAWTRPVMEKGCPVCDETDQEQGAPWRYMPDPDTGEPRVVCASCYEVILQTAQQPERKED